MIQRGRRRIAIECKASTAPELTPDFYRSIEDLQPEFTWVAAPVREVYPIGKNIQRNAPPGVAERTPAHEGIIHRSLTDRSRLP